ncbi:MAG: hypothetical protein GC160_03375 [Acidobacteria bacterium]|nr:hypothetical protein [Acidobacteriota bacterium]
MRIAFTILVLAVAGVYGWSLYQEKFGGPEIDARDQFALRTVHELIEAQDAYRDKYHRYARKLYELGPPLMPGGPSENGANLIPRDIATGKKLSYEFSVREYGNAFIINADPIGPPTSPDSAPLRHFYADQSGKVRFAVGHAANEGSELVR